MQGISGIASPVRGVRPVMRVAWRGLAGVLFGADPSPSGRWRSPWQRRIAYTVLGGAMLLLCAASLASLAGGPAWAGPCPGAKPRELAGRMVIHCLGAHPLLGILGGPMNLWALVAAGVVVVPLALAVRYPLLGWRIGWLGLLLVPLLGLDWRGGLPWGPAQILVLLVLLCAAGIRRERAVLGWLWALTLVPWWFWILWRGPGVVTAALGSVAFLAMAVAVDRAGAGRQIQRDLAEQAEQTELERARRIALEERTRIARELHDVVAHHMSLMAIRAESAPHRLRALPDPVRAEFGALSGSAREALADMRRLLGVLRSDQPTGRAPQPGLPDLPGLIDSARQAGMAVELISAPDAGPGAAGHWRMRLPDHPGSPVQRRPARGRSPGHSIGTPRGGHGDAPGDQRPRGSRRAARKRPRVRPRPGRDAGTGRTAGRLAVGRAGT